MFIRQAELQAPESFWNLMPPRWTSVRAAFPARVPDCGMRVIRHRGKPGLYSRALKKIVEVFGGLCQLSTHLRDA
jgi:hypothetical protein